MHFWGSFFYWRGWRAMCLVSSSFIHEAPTETLSDSLSTSLSPSLPFFSLSGPVRLCLPLNWLLVSMSLTHPQTHTATFNINSSPTYTRLFSWTRHGVTFRSCTDWISSVSYLFHPLLLRGFSLHLWVKYGRRQRATHDCLKALKGGGWGDTTQFHNSHFHTRAFLKAKTV